MMRGSQAIGIDTNPANSIAITLANANVNALKAIDIITSEIIKEAHINQYDVPSWILAFEMLTNTFKEILSEDMLKVYEEAKEHFSYSAITMGEPKNE